MIFLIICPILHQSVSLNGVSTSFLPVTCGIPQGSILLFLIYINDMNTAMEFSTTYHFLDNGYDSSVFKSPQGRSSVCTHPKLLNHINT